MRLPYKNEERKLFKEKYKYIVAVDEVGMGCLAGPVVVCAVLITKNFLDKRNKKLYWLRDSKQLLPRQRENYFKILTNDKNFIWTVSYCYPKTIDKINIYQAARKAMRRAIKKLLNRLKPDSKTIVLVDGKNKIKGLNLEQKAIVKGDRRVFSIACASLVAKVTRDKMMIRYGKKFQDYGFEKHKGYGTKGHQIQLNKFGPSKIHRKSFAPVAKLI